MYQSVEEIIRMVNEQFHGDRIAQIFENCFRDTLDKTIKKENGSSFVITGDIPAMWLRDSTCEMIT